MALITLPNHQSAIRNLQSNAGALSLDRNYDPFGNLEASAGSGSSMFGFTGEQTDSMEMLYLRAREYDLSQFEEGLIVFPFGTDLTERPNPCDYRPNTTGPFTSNQFDQ
jgi:hypothetical protein